MPGAEAVADGGAESDPLGGDGVPLRTQRSTDAPARHVAMQLDQLLAANEVKPRRERLTLVRLFEALRGLGYEGGYDAVRRYAKTGESARGGVRAAYIPLSFAPGEAYQFDWSHEIVVINGVTGGEGRAPASVPQPHAVRARLSAREPGDGV